MRRILPDFKNLVGNAKITMSVKRFPQQTDTATTLSPFTITSSTNKVDTLEQEDVTQTLNRKR